MKDRNKDTSWWWYIVALFLGWNAGVGIEQGSTEALVMLILQGVLLSILLCYLAYEFFSGSKIEKENLEAIERAEEMLKEYSPVIKDLFGAPSTTVHAYGRPTREHRTLTGDEASEDVKKRAFESYVRENAGTADIWNAMPEFARESWYKATEEEDKEKTDRLVDDGKEDEITGEDIAQAVDYDVCRKLAPGDEGAIEPEFCLKEKGHKGPHAGGKSTWDDAINNDIDYDGPRCDHSYANISEGRLENCYLKEGHDGEHKYDYKEKA